MILEGEDFRLTVEIEAGRLGFRTSSYREKLGSVLSPAVYNQDFSAMLAAAVPAALAFLLLSGHGLWRYPALIAAYAAGFLFFRAFIFKKRFLTLEADKNMGRALIRVPFKGTRSFRIEDIEKVEAAHTAIQPENREGLRQVERIALHHHTVLPELDKTVDFYTVRIYLKEGRPRMKKGPASGAIGIYSGRDSRSAAELTLNIRNFLFPEMKTEN